MKTFVDFAADAATEEKLGREFAGQLTSGKPATLKVWFDSKGYRVTETDCASLIERERMVETGPVHENSPY